MADASGFIWFELMTTDLDKAVAFYGPVVGWETRDSGMPGTRYLIFGKGGKDVGGMMSWTSIGENKPTKWMGHIHTADVDTETKAVVADGGTLYRPPQEIPGVGRFGVMADPQGAEYLLFQPNPPIEAPSRLPLTEPGGMAWCELATTDSEKAWEFYSKHYGWTADEAFDMGPMGSYQTFKLDGEVSGGGMMNIPAGMAEAIGRPAWSFYFAVDDIKATAERVKEAGGTITQGPMQVPGGGWVLRGLDTQGGQFAFLARG